MGRVLIKRIENDPDLAQFNCGNGSIHGKIRDSYYATLLKEGYAYEIRLEGKVIGHYMLMVSRVAYDTEFHTTHGGNMVSAVKLDYLAIDCKYQKLGYGTGVLKYIVKEVRDLCDRAPIRLLSLEALPDKAKWYIDNGFRPYNTKDLTSGKPLVAMYMDFSDSKAVSAYCKSSQS